MTILVNENESISALSETLRLRSDEVQEFISRKPNYFIRCGTLLFFCVLILISTVCWFIQYPDIVVSKARLTSINAPKEVITRSEGKLQQISATNGNRVKQGTVLAYMESIANPTAVLQVQANLDSILLKVSQNKIEQIVKYFPDYTKQLYLKELGDLQQPFQNFMQSFISFRDFISNGFYLQKLNMLQTDLSNMIRLHKILKEQQMLLEQDVALSKQTFDANEILAKDKVISALDYRNEQSKFIGKQLSMPQIKSAILTNESLQNDKRKEIAELEITVLLLPFSSIKVK